ncbi:MAG: AI-2E family transporter [Planctomycetes bacterium]|nr:AI-2E family transporter [Planctomycetota bacterium]
MLPSDGSDERPTSGQPKPIPNLARLHIWQVQAFRDLLVIAVVVGVVWAGYALRFVTVPLLLAFLLAYLVEPLVRWMCRVLRMSRSVAVTSLLATCGVAIAAGLLLVVPTVVRQAEDVVDKLKGGQFDAWIDKAEAVLPAEYRAEVKRVRAWISLEKSPLPSQGNVNAPDQPSAEGANAPAGAPSPGSVATPPSATTSAAATPPPTDASAGEITATFSKALLSPTTYDTLDKLVGLSGLLFAAVLIPFYFWFFSVSFPSAVEFLGSLVPNAQRERVFELASEMDAAVAGFVRGRILIALGMGVMFAIGWWINGVPYALTLGMLAGVLSIAPYLGIVVLVPAIGLLAAQQLQIADESQRLAWYWIFGGPPLVYVIVQSIEGYVLTPIFSGKATNLGPVSIFVAVLAGASVAGLYGMLLAIPTAACAKILVRETVMPSLRRWTEGKSSDFLPLDRE